MTKADMATVKAYLGRYSAISNQIGRHMDQIRFRADQIGSLDDYYIITPAVRESHERLLALRDELDQQDRGRIKELEVERDKLVAAVDAVEDPEGREAVRLHYFQGMAFSEIAEKLCLSERQLYRRLNNKVYPEILRNI